MRVAARSGCKRVRASRMVYMHSDNRGKLLLFVNLKSNISLVIFFFFIAFHFGGVLCSTSDVHGGNLFTMVSIRRGVGIPKFGFLSDAINEWLLTDYPIQLHPARSSSQFRGNRVVKILRKFSIFRNEPRLGKKEKFSFKALSYFLTLLRWKVQLWSPLNL